jgi:rusticyanin
MTLIVNPPRTDPRQPPQRRRRLTIAAVAAGLLVAVSGGVGIGLAAAGGNSSGTASPATAASYAYYQSMMGRYANAGGSMMGASYTSGGSPMTAMMGRSGYVWMMGGASAPGWMMGGALPSAIMGESTDMGKVMGALFAGAPGARVSPSQAAALGSQIPAGSSVDPSASRITFAGPTVKLAVLASPAGGPDETFRVAGLVNPTIAVPKGAHVTIQVVNADRDTAHGLVVTGSGTASSSYMPMMTTSSAFGGSVVWFLANPTSAGMHIATISFTASATGTYEYLCPVPGHAQKGMVGTFMVS